MSGVNLALDDAVELTELLQFLNTWLTTDHEQLNTSLRRFVGHPAYDISKLKADLAGSPSSSAATPTASSSNPHQPHNRHTP